MVARSVGEAEYHALAQGVIEIMWLKSLFSEVGYPLSGIPILWCDNLAAKSITENAVFHSRTKHIEIDVHFVREKMEKGEIEIRYVLLYIKWRIFLLKDCPKIGCCSYVTNLGCICLLFGCMRL